MSEPAADEPRLTTTALKAVEMACSYMTHLLFETQRSEVKERMKKSKQEKAAQRAAEAKKATGKATKNAPRAGGARGGKR